MNKSIAILALVAIPLLRLCGEPIPGWSPNVLESLIYYNSFSTRDYSAKPDLCHVTCDVEPVKSKLNADGISGASVSPESMWPCLSLKSSKLGLLGGRTYSFWFRLNKPLTKNSSLGLIRISGKKGQVSAFARGGPWCGLKDTAGVGQLYVGPNQETRLFDKQFRKHYSDDQWHHCVLTSDGRTVKVYLDSILITVMTADKRRLLKDDALDMITLGGENVANVSYDEFCVFDAPLTYDRIKEYYQMMKTLKIRERLISE